MGNPTKLVADNQLILDAPLLQVPLELIRRNFKTAQRAIDKETKAITASLNEATQKVQLGIASPDETIASIDLMIKRMQTLKRKVRICYLACLTCAFAACGSSSRRGALASSVQSACQTCGKSI